ncbi:Topoisomerase DNA binding C4 zinc finger [Marinobacterium stanieri]|uniref:Topoisomerase DNA binding C4 zinc finger n=1 Tax=Marinobacterium stanieri TaxID=49186 RepID=A0A1N6VQE0_9GAMM|nr:Topoisomerase DNA binding C4 zinc finger [Marinobacterium stanieri]
MYIYDTIYIVRVKGIVVKQIEAGRYPRSFATHRQHVKLVKSIVEAKEAKDDLVACPKCGSDMVLREAKRGENKGQQLWGCSKFPSCCGVIKAG